MNEIFLQSPSTTAIAWGTGDSPPPYKNIGLPLPPHVVYLSIPPYSTSGSYLLLDTELGVVVEVRQDGTRMMPPEEYDVLPEHQKWMAHETLPAKDFFSRESQRLRKLVYVPVPRPSGEPRFYHRSTTHLDEAELLEIEDEYDADQKVDSDYSPSDDAEEEGATDLPEEGTLMFDSSEDEDDDAEDLEISDKELEALRADAEQEVTVPNQITASLGRWEPIELSQDTIVSLAEL